MYPLHQPRLIYAVEQLTNEATHSVNSHQETEAFKSASADRMDATRSKLDSRTNDGSNINDLITDNSIVEDRKTISLRERGDSCVEDAINVKDKLSALITLVRSYHEQCNSNIEGTATFLHRALLDAQRLGIAAPDCVAYEIVKRQVIHSLTDGNVCGGLAALDDRNGMACGISVITCAEKRKHVASAILQDCFAELLGLPPSDTNEDLAH